jgi:hypothetical protein
MAVNTDTQQGLKMGLSAINVGNRLSFIVNATVSGANTYAAFRANVAANIGAAGVYASNAQAGNVAILRGLDQANEYGILTDTNLNGLTTVAGVQALFTAQAPELPLTYALSLPN